MHLHTFSKRGASHDASMLVIKVVALQPVPTSPPHTRAQQLVAGAVTVFIGDRLARAAALLVVSLAYLLLGLRNPPYYRAAPNEFRVAAAASCVVASLLG